ncbi:MAG: phosphoadenosine phosphosulfate reductase [Sulfitobacter sp.]
MQHMQQKRHATVDFGPSLCEVPDHKWLNAVKSVVQPLGGFETLSEIHSATFLEGSSTLLVSFESISGIRNLSPSHHPFGWDMARDFGWSHLCLLSPNDTWFRDPAVFGYFDSLVDDSFFDAFDNIIFYGAGSCGYAAAAFSVAAPGSTVFVIQPQATLDHRITEWDTRFRSHRRADFTNRYGYAPDMLDAAGAAFVVYDPAQQLDAMHAALFNADNVTRLRMRNMGADLEKDLLRMNVLHDVVKDAAQGELTLTNFAKHYRARRDDPSYLRSLLRIADTKNRPPLAHAICKNVVSRMKAPRFAARLKKAGKT